MFARDFRSLARDSLNNNWKDAVLVTLVSIIISGGFFTILVSIYRVFLFFENGLRGLSYDDVYYYLLSINSGKFSLLFSFLTIVMAVLGSAVKLGLCQYNMHLVMRYPQKPFKTLFERFSIIHKAFLLSLVTGLFVFLWSMLFVIPGIIALYRYSFAPYILAQNPDMGVMDAIRKSKELTYGRKWRLFCLEISFIGWSILNAFTMNIGSLWLMPYMNASYAAFYLDAAGQLPYRRDEHGNVPGSQPSAP